MPRQRKKTLSKNFKRIASENSDWQKEQTLLGKTGKYLQPIVITF